MTGGHANGRRGGSSRSGARAGNVRIGRKGARRLLEGAPPADRDEARVLEVLEALARPESDQSHQSHERARIVPLAVINAFAQQASTEVVDVSADPAPASRSPRATRARPGARARGIRGALTVKLAAVLVVISSGAMAAAAGGVLPAPAQSAAHSLFGSWGVPAPTPSSTRHDGQPGTATQGSSTQPGTAATSAPTSATAPGSSHPAGHGWPSLTPCSAAATTQAAVREHGFGRDCVASPVEATPTASDRENGNGNGNGNGDGNGIEHTRTPTVGDTDSAKATIGSTPSVWQVR